MVSVNIASLKDRKELLIKTVDSIINQVDRVNLYLNYYDENPYPHEKVNYILGNNELMDAHKFTWCEEQEDGYMLFLDDDLEVPEDYVEYMIKGIDRFGIVSLHGRSFASYPISSYYHPNVPSFRFHCLNEVKFNEPVTFCGTGVLGFNLKSIRPPMSIFKRGGMADIYFSLYADSLGLTIWVLAHESGYIKYLHPDNTIWDNDHRNDHYQTKIVNQYFTK